MNLALPLLSVQPYGPNDQRSHRRLGRHNPSGWGGKTAAGIGMAGALNFAMSIDPLVTDGGNKIKQLAILVASIISYFEDPGGK